MFRQDTISLYLPKMVYQFLAVRQEIAVERLFVVYIKPREGARVYRVHTYLGMFRTPMIGKAKFHLVEI